MRVVVIEAAALAVAGALAVEGATGAWERRDHEAVVTLHVEVEVPSEPAPFSVTVAATGGPMAHALRLGETLTLTDRAALDFS